MCPKHFAVYVPILANPIQLTVRLKSFCAYALHTYFVGWKIPRCHLVISVFFSYFGNCAVSFNKSCFKYSVSYCLVFFSFYKNRKKSFLVRTIYVAKICDIPYRTIYKRLENWNFEIKYFRNCVGHKFYSTPVDAEFCK